jgi:hypothetical protein
MPWSPPTRQPHISTGAVSMGAVSTSAVVPLALPLLWGLRTPATPRARRAGVD